MAKKGAEVRKEPVETPITDREKYLAEIKELTVQLQAVELEWAKRSSLANDRELLLLAIAERKGIIAYLNLKGE